MKMNVSNVQPHLYQEDEDFDNVYNNIANFIIEESNNGDLVYVVPGHPRVAERTWCN